MSLTEAEKQRIYEEEKARIEAQERARAEIDASKKPKSFQLDAQKSKNQLIGLIAIVAVIATISYVERSTGGHDVNTSTVTGAMDAVTGGSLTMDKYNRIQTGMTYQQVCDLIGEQGQEMSHVEVMGMKSAMYSWQNPSGANMNAQFENGKLMAKAQFGLN